MNRVFTILVALMVIVALLGNGVCASETRAAPRPASRHKNKNKNKHKSESHHGIEHESHHGIEHESHHGTEHGYIQGIAPAGSTDTCGCVAACIQGCSYTPP